jgi:hypothetical protein
MNLDSHLSLQMVAFVSGDSLVKDLRKLVLCRLTTLVAEACVMPIDHFGCGSLMVCGGVHYAKKTNSLNLFSMPLMIICILYCGMAFHSMMNAFSNSC